MTEIPEDVMKAARDAVNSAIDDRGAIGVIARAILTERERCAQAAISVICNRGGQRDDELIDAIRKGAAT